MPAIEFNRAEKDSLVQGLQRYFSDELDQELGQFDAEFLLDFISGTIGPYYYNRGLYDAQAVLHDRMEQLGEAISELEQAVERA